MKKIIMIALLIISVLIFSNSKTYANYPYWQFPYFYSQYGQSWGFQSFMPRYFGSLNSLPQSWSSQLRLSTESSPSFIFNSSPSIPPFGNMPNNLSYIPSINSLGYLSMGNWGSPSFYALPPPSNYYPMGWRPQGPFYSYNEPLFGHDNTKNPYASDALWNLNWDLEDTDITLEMPDDGESITVDIGETIGFILPNYRDNYDADVEWELDEDELDENIVEKISDERFPGYWYYNGGSRPVFKDGVEQWIFKAIGLGTTTIKLDCINREDDNTGTIEIEVKVTD